MAATGFSRALPERLRTKQRAFFFGSMFEVELAACKTLAKKKHGTCRRIAERHRHAVHVHVRRERPPRRGAREERVDVVRMQRRVARVLRNFSRRDARQRLLPNDALPPAPLRCRRDVGARLQHEQAIRHV